MFPVSSLDKSYKIVKNKNVILTYTMLYTTYLKVYNLYFDFYLKLLHSDGFYGQDNKHILS